MFEFKISFLFYMVLISDDVLVLIISYRFCISDDRIYFKYVEA